VSGSQSAIRVQGVEPIGDYCLQMQWTNGKVMIVDLCEPIFRVKGLRPLRDQTTFAKASIGEGGFSVVWPEGQDMGVGRLYEMALEQNGHEDAAEFNRWRWKHGLSLAGAADALGISRRAVAYYASGDQPVPRSISLACLGWEAELSGKRAVAAA
jgi:hypothetical protein